MKGIVIKTIDFTNEFLSKEKDLYSFNQLEAEYLSKEEEDKELITVIQIEAFKYRYYFRYK